MDYAAWCLFSTHFATRETRFEVGERADLDEPGANLLDDIHNIRTIRSVLANGILYDPKPLWESVGFRPE